MTTYLIEVILALRRNMGLSGRISGHEEHHLCAYQEVRTTTAQELPEYISLFLEFQDNQVVPKPVETSRRQPLLLPHIPS